MEKFQGKYRISSTRLQNWDYASSGMYFVTLCTTNRVHYFGQIKSETDTEHTEMQLSGIGKIVESEWLRTHQKRPDMNISFGEYQVMPNHFHAILIIGDNLFNTSVMNHATDENPVNSCRDAIPRDSGQPESKSVSESQSYFNPDSNQMFELETRMILNSNFKGKNKFAPQSKNLGSIMRGFKSAVTMYALDHNIVFGWQPRYYDHIIRNHEQYLRIAEYIRNNPTNWGNDKLR